MRITIISVICLNLPFIFQTSTLSVSSRERTASTSSTWSSMGRTSLAVRSRFAWENRDRAAMPVSSLPTEPVWREEPQVVLLTLRVGTGLKTIMQKEQFPLRRQCVSALWILIAWCFFLTWHVKRKLRSLAHVERSPLFEKNDLNRRILDYLTYFSWITSRTNVCLHCNSTWTTWEVAEKFWSSPRRIALLQNCCKCSEALLCFARNAFQLHESKDKKATWLT